MMDKARRREYSALTFAKVVSTVRMRIVKQNRSAGILYKFTLRRGGPYESLPCWTVTEIDDHYHVLCTAAFGSNFVNLMRPTNRLTNLQGRVFPFLHP
jgi:hypothetical protein